jgi:uncharacterized protein with NRDE domain
MCLILLAYRQHPHYPLVLAANRDEFHARATAVADYWPEAPHILGGKDLEAGGTWLAVDNTGRFAAVTNYRDPGHYHSGKTSRGLLISEFLLNDHAAADYLTRIHAKHEHYNGFNIVLGDHTGLWYYCNRTGQKQTLTPASYGISNRVLDTPWPKVIKGKRELSAVLTRNQRPDPESILTLLADRTQPADNALPDTGIDSDWERLLAPVFIVSPTYGTRASTVLLIDQEYTLTFVERSFSADSEATGTIRHTFKIATRLSPPSLP